MRSETLRRFAAHVSLVLLWSAVAGVTAQQPDREPDISGVWETRLDAAGRELLRFRIVYTAGPDFSGVFEAPLWDSDSASLSNGRIEDHRVSFEIQAIGARFTGRLNSAGDVISGVWTQWESPTPLTLWRVRNERRIPRPQDPEPPYPYLHDVLILENPETRQRIAGTLTWPADGPAPLVILLSGAGPQNRDNELAGHRMFLVLSDYLARHGFATWRMDDRGVGQSDGDYNNTTIEDLVGDVRFVLSSLARRGELDLRRIGIIAHGEGGWVGARVAESDRAVRFLVLLNTPALPGDETEFARMRESARFEKGAPPDPDWVDAEIEMLRKAAAIRDIHRDESEAAIIEHTQKWIESTIGQWPPDARARVGPITEYAAAVARRLNLKRVRDARSFDPIRALGGVRCPVLAIMGGVDVEVPGTDHGPALEALAATNRNIRIHKAMFWNHLLQATRERSVSAYAAIDETIAPEAMDLMRDWCKPHAR